jgi:hypothetical protein
VLGRQKIDIWNEIYMHKLNSRSLFAVPFVMALTSLGCTSSGSSPATIQTGPDAELSFDGLHMVDNSKADLAWARPDLDLSGYDKIMLGDAEFEYRHTQNRGRSKMERSTAGPYFIDDQGRRKFEEVASDAFLEELRNIQNFTFVNEPGPDVLLIRGGLLDVVSFVPADGVTRSEIYVSSIGAATLVLELRDSQTNAILARSIDRRDVEQLGSVREVNRATTISEVKRLMRLWAKRLHEGLDGFVQPAAAQ